MKMRLVDGLVADLSETPNESYHPSIAGQFIDVPEGAPSDLRPGYRYVDGVWTAPPVAAAGIPTAPPEPTFRTLVSVARFKAQFPLASQIAIELARAYVPVDPGAPDMTKAVRKAGLDVLYGMLADLVASGSPIELADTAVVEGIDWMAEQGFISPEQADVIKRGVPVPAGAST